MRRTHSLPCPYVYGVNRVSRDASGSYEYYHSDGLGSTRQLSNDSQSLTQTTTYDAFGNIESSTGSSSNAYRYAGQHGYRNDGDDGLMHVGARYYDPLVGRFISADTWLGEAGRPQSLNRYVYTEDDPINLVDPSGRISIPPDEDIKQPPLPKPVPPPPGPVPSPLPPSFPPVKGPIKIPIKIGNGNGTIVFDPPPPYGKGPDIGGVINWPIGGGISIGLVGSTTHGGFGGVAIIKNF